MSRFPIQPLVVLGALATLACEGPDAPPLDRDLSAMEDSAALTAAGTDYSFEVDVTQHIGQQFPPFPAGVQGLAGALVQHKDAPLTRAPWNMTKIQIGGRPALWLSKTVARTTEPMIGKDGERFGTRTNPTFQVTDAVLLPPLDTGERLQLSACHDRDGRVAASYVTWEPDSRVMDQVRLAWSPDEVSGTLVSIDPVGIVCRNRRFPDE